MFEITKEEAKHCAIIKTDKGPIRLMPKKVWDRFQKEARIEGVRQLTALYREVMPNAPNSKTQNN